MVTYKFSFTLITFVNKRCTTEVDKVTSGQNVDPAALLERYRTKQEDIRRYIGAYREYCWTVKGIEDYRVAVFHILAAEGQVFSGEKHIWHMENIRKYITGIDPIYMETAYICVDTEDEASVKAGVDWWLALTGEG